MFDNDQPQDGMAMLAQLLGGGSPDDELNEQTAIDTITEYLKREQTPHNFKVGDLVTFAEGANKKWAGRPMVVVEVFDEPIRTGYSVEHGSPDALTPAHGRIAIPFPPMGKLTEPFVKTFAENFQDGTVIAYTPESER